jgi:hypothetical protein
MEAQHPPRQSRSAPTSRPPVLAAEKRANLSFRARSNNVTFTLFGNQMRIPNAHSREHL